MAVKLTNFIAVFRTGQLIHFDWACNALEEAGVPFQRREETSGGIRFAMPAAPATGPGVWWTVLVPENFAEKAHEVLAGLPFENGTQPDVWSFQPTHQIQSGWQIYSWVMILVLAAFGISWVVKILQSTH
jgi:Putative prokaryotic signal transducing protein